MSRLSLSLLGPPRIARDGVSVHVPRRKALALLAYLAVTGQVHRRDALAALFWPEHDQSHARAGLRRALSALREALGDGWLDADRESVGLNRDAEIDLDVRAFRERLARCRDHDHPPQEACPACLSLLAEVAALYEGDFLAGFTLRDSPAFDDWQFFQTQGLRDELAGALQRLVDGHSARGAFEPAIAYARRWLGLDPLHEPAHRWLIRLYAWSGQRAAALRQVAECERVLQEELGAPPEQETSDLYQAIVEHRELPSPVQESLPETEAPVLPRHNLPIQLIPFVGRQALLAQIEQRLDDPGCRLLTLVGPGGSGKTRLALEAAGRRLDGYADGVFFVPLAPLEALESIVPTIAQAVGFSFHGDEGPKEQLLNYLRQKRMLLLLDNAEHLVRQDPADIAAIAADILKAAPQVAVLVTSRVALHVQGEHRFPIEGMDYPQQTPDVWHRYSAIKLFLQSARRAQPGFELVAENATDVVRICRLVEGMPLGILLAATWAATLTPAEIAREIEGSLDFLQSDWRDVPDRQRSLRAVYNHSWTLLSTPQRAAMQALSVFRGGFTRGAADRIAGASLRDLSALVDQSLLHRTPGGRYEVHELVRQYAAEQLAAQPETAQQVRERHAAFYAAALEQWGEALKGAGQLAALAEIEADIGNARVAWSWAVAQGQTDLLERAMDGLCRFYEWRGRYEEGEAACRAVVDALAGATDGERERLRAKALAWRGAFDHALRRLERARDLLEESLVLLEASARAEGEAQRERAFALWQLGYTLYDLGQWQAARQQYERSVAIYRALRDRWGMASVLHPLGDLLCMAGAPGRAESLVREGLGIQQALEDGRGAAGSLRVLSVAAVGTGRFEEAERRGRESVAAFRAVSDRAHAAEALLNLGYALVHRGQFAEARAELKESKAIYRDLGSYGSSSGFSDLFLALANLMDGRYDEAGTEGQAALTLSRETGMMAGVGYALLLLGCLDLATGEHAQLQQIAREAYSLAGGQTMLRHSWTLPILGAAARQLGQPDRARQHLCTALREECGQEDLSGVLFALPIVSLLLVDRGEAERAAELYALASRYPLVANAQWFEDVAGAPIAAAAQALPPDVVAAAQERGRARDLWVTVEELLAELEAEGYGEESTVER